jgi:hypothetical protein
MPESQKFMLPSGETLEVTPSDFSAAFGLFKAICGSLKGMKMPEEVLNANLGQNPLESIRKNVALFSVLMEKFTEIVGNKAVEDAVFQCGRRAVYAGKFTFSAGLMDDPAVGQRVREDFLFIALRIAEVNCKPFLAPIFSKLKTLRPSAADSQK